MLSVLLRDLHYGFRQIRNAPMFTLTVILTLGLGIGATTAIFSLIHAVMLKSLPVADPARLYRIGTGATCCYSGHPQGDWGIFSYDFYQRIRRSTPQFEQIAAFQAKPDVLSVRYASHAAQAQALIGEYVSGNYFDTLGVGPFAGRLFTEADDTHNSAPVAVLSYHAWQQDFAGDPAIVGSFVTIENSPFTIVGIAPPGFFGETLSSNPPAIWVTLEAEYITDGNASFNRIPSSAWLRVIGRMRPGGHPGGSIAAASAQLTAALQHWLVTDAAMMPASRSELLAQLSRQTIGISSASSGIGMMRKTYGSSLGILLAICALVLLLACANVANLQLARGLTRRAQIALMSALGASRHQLVRQALTESLLLGLLGGVAGIFIACPGARLVMALAFGRADFLRVGLSMPMLGSCAALALLSGILFGTLPAWMQSRARPIEAMRGLNARGYSSRSGASRLRSTLVVLQTAVSVVVLASAGLLTRSLLQLEQQDFGFATGNRISVLIEPPLAAYTLDHLNALYRQLQYGLVALPGVRGVGLALDGPFTGRFRETVVKPGEGMPRYDGSQTVIWDRISPGYFQTMAQKLVAGRDFTEEDNATTRGVAIVNRAFVRRFFPGEDPVGKLFGFAAPANSTSFQIVGVVADAKYQDPDQPAAPMVFAPLAQRLNYAGSATEDLALQDNDKWSHFITGVQLWVAADPAKMEPRIRNVFRQVDPNFAITAIQTMQHQVAVNFDQQRLLARLSGFFGVLALLLATIGLYGVTAYNVVRRTGEIGVRMAIGANRRNIVALVLRGAMVQTILGLALGLPAALLAGRLLASRLYRVGIADPVSLLLPLTALLLSALLASILPAARAASVEPLEALRIE